MFTTYCIRRILLYLPSETDALSQGFPQSCDRAYWTADYTDPTPDRFTFAILNSSEFEIPTEGLGSELLGVDMKLPLVIETYKGTDGSDPKLETPSVSAVPEPQRSFSWWEALLSDSSSGAGSKAAFIPYTLYILNIVFNLNLY